MRNLAEIEQLNNYFQVSSQIHPDEVRLLMSRDSLDVRETVFHFLTEPHVVKKIVPPLTLEEVDAFAREYLMECIWADVGADWSDTNPQDSDVDTSYSAAGAISNWLKRLADDGDPDDLIPVWRETLGLAYKDGDARVRDVLINGAVDHILEHRVLRRLFRVWEEDPVLCEAYAQGMLWVSNLRPEWIGEGYPFDTARSLRSDSREHPGQMASGGGAPDHEL